MWSAKLNPSILSRISNVRLINGFTSILPEAIKAKARGNALVYRNTNSMDGALGLNGFVGVRREAVGVALVRRTDTGERGDQRHVSL
jgi:hypothetical protein